MKEVIMKVPSFSADYPKAPIYVADLVRCKECKWCVEDDYIVKCWNIKGLNKTDGVVNLDDFCSYGERKSE